MKNKGIVIFLIVLAVVIIAVIAGDYLSGRPDKSAPNPFAYDVNDFKNVPEEIIHFKETKNFKLGFEVSSSLAIENDKLYVSGDNKLQIIDISGKLITELNLPGKPQTVEVAKDIIYTSVNNQILVYSETGNLLKEWEPLDGNSLITAIAAFENNVFVADAGKRKVIRYNLQGEKLAEFDGKADEGVIHGFIIPSPFFDLDINTDGDLWVVNPGLHALENYTEDGNLREHWNNTTMQTEGFSGCCNPAYFTFLPDGRFVTSEKGLVRIKTYKPSGEFEGVVAAPAKFKDDGEAPDVAADSQGNIYALDFDKKMIRVFEPK
jgi:outer membrane protein assembly factor BamB